MTTKKKQEFDIRIWCEGCCIRIAPNEERVEAGGKSYHVGCSPKKTRTKKIAADA